MVVMEVFPLGLMSIMGHLPETPRWFFGKDPKEDAIIALKRMHGEEAAKSKFEELDKAQREESEEKIGYSNMLILRGRQFHPSIVTIMGQVNQAFIGYGAVRSMDLRSSNSLDSRLQGRVP
jgi:hypothetical protein